MKIIVGSLNAAKIAAVSNCFPLPNYEVVGVNSPSDVANQPFSDIETRQGAINRARSCLTYEGVSIGVGLEGGVMYLENELFLCNWGALVTKCGKIITASGARILLPEDIKLQLEAGTELGDIMDKYSKRNDVRSKEGAIGIFTNHLVTRSELFSHIVLLLKGQWELSLK